ncbi:MAG: cytochrome-c oxidase, cbb3-type subunit III [Aestuariivita sp.]|nr:cytochrome-c oxidase, cbb3-type subunit III [Aestuariivita sp.]MCY4201405.1 cytochrome-c oxidase, cbb3-type subunit III [Aestuariivita sp.]MCY4290061.1 cytochrome-c oxidase, cbb3-type subunit III [Aestuariivita sp.]MCY4346846.1 cytochrome-c oxidase, cbb3-type subunit III [Aestuariivita sp.]
MKNDIATSETDDVATTGHVWDEDLEEFNNPLPRWWLWTFYATIIWGVGYTIAYPAWPMISSSTAGLIGYSTRNEVVEDIAAFEAQNEPINLRLVETELVAIADDAELYTYAVSSGESVYQTWCAQCHGSGAAGAVGYPNLLDDDWLWGGDIEAIHHTVSHGIRNEVSDEAHYSAMPAFGELLTEEEISQVANFVQAMAGETPADATQAEAGKVIYEENCSSCHGEQGEGDIFQGAPNLADSIWLYGGDYASLISTVTYSRYGVMPPWNDRLSEPEIRAVSLYVHQLGGGE